MLSEKQKIEIKLTAILLVGKVYKYGAEVNPETKPEDIVGIDCSELIEYCFGRAGIKIPDGAINQFNASEPIEREKLETGDLAFKRSKETKIINHSALVIDGKEIIEAEGFFRKIIQRPIEKFMTVSEKAKSEFAGFRRFRIDEKIA